jgi:hypothetical protein
MEFQTNSRIKRPGVLTRTHLFVWLNLNLKSRDERQEQFEV